MPDRPKIYLETSVISYLVARPSPDPEKAAMWRYAMRFMNEYAQGYDIVVSDIVAKEAVRGDPGEYYDDPIVREVHEARYEIMAEFGGDVNAFFDYLVAHPVPNARYVSPKPFTYESVAGD